jgi:hypothetical protein
VDKIGSIWIYSSCFERIIKVIEYVNNFSGGHNFNEIHVVGTGAEFF